MVDLLFSRLISWVRPPSSSEPALDPRLGLLANVGLLGEDYAVGWAWAYLSVSVVGAALVVNAYRPWRSGPVSVFSFFGGWLTGELPIQNIVWQALATVSFGQDHCGDRRPGACRAEDHRR
jgi:hypothetical protein